MRDYLKEMITPNGHDIHTRQDSRRLQA